MLGSPGTRRTSSSRQRTGRDAPDGQRHPLQATGTAGRLRWGNADAMHEVGSGQGSLPSRRFGATAGPALRGDAPAVPVVQWKLPSPQIRGLRLDVGGPWGSVAVSGPMEAT